MVGYTDLTRHTREFVDVMTGVARDFHAAVKANVMTWQDIGQISLNVPPIFGRKATLTYVGSGSIASVYKLVIGRAAYALKINRMTRGAGSDLEVMDLGNRMHHLVRRTHIGATFDIRGRSYSWVLSDFMATTTVNSFHVAREKLYCAHLVHGLWYTDLTLDNIKGGRIIDLGGLDRDRPELNRHDLDWVKRLVYFMRTGDRASFARWLDRTADEVPHVLMYLYAAMGSYAATATPGRFVAYRDMVNQACRRLPPGFPVFADYCR